MKHVLFLLIWFITVCSVATTTLLGQEKLNDTKLSRISYGKQEAQVGVRWSLGNDAYCEGPQGLTIDADGNVYIADIINGKIKKFSAEGELLSLTEGKIICLNYFLVDQEGSIFVLHGVACDTITKFSVNEKRVWSRSFNDIVNKDTYSSIEKEFDIGILSQFGKLTLGLDGAIFAEVVGWTKKDNIGRSLTVKLDNNGKFVDVLPSFGVEGGGKWWRVELPENNVPFFSTINVKCLSKDGQLVQTLEIPITNDDAHFKDFLPDGGVNIIPDYQNGFVLLTYAPIKIPIQITPIEKIKIDIVVSRYDGKGSFVEQFRFPSTPFASTSHNIAFAKDGKLYYLIFDRTGIDIMSHNDKTTIALATLDIKQ